MQKTISVTLIAAVTVFVLLLVVGFFQSLLLTTTGNSLPVLGGNMTPQFNSTTNSSSTVTANGQIIISQANNKGIYLRVDNNGNVPVYCGLTNSTSSLLQAGVLLNVSSSPTLPLEVMGYNGAVSCIASGTGNVSFSYR